MSLSHDERRRYRRHLLLREIGGQGQKALAAAKVLVVGAGGLGCPILSYLAAAGVGRIGICDGDVVELSNLQRQTLYTTSDVGQLKAEMARKRLLAINPLIDIRTHTVFMKEDNAVSLIHPYDIIVEGLDRYESRYTVNEACRRERKTLVSAAIGRFDGQVAVFRPGQPDEPCYACLVSEAPDDEAACEAEGVLGAVPGVVGSLAAIEVIKLICDMHNPLRRELMIYQGLEGRMRRVRLSRDPACTVCGTGRRT
ncbi:HesA/MoeB/ThiF family protein [Parvularcula sp. LCG005]|uniref:HesA/MoeB/ThiF family protein n=1 Tax=Parvularcula sp. LCG005 TaxID=3078805 RepID=UPI002942CF61|nr:HesA/MoeB/ThiF family protein [Parvularcula sp. LCG005]WOI53263.1 HesA/MoeB/ThiF family protein [Parvularcula sp. LCG005]